MFWLRFGVIIVCVLALNSLLKVLLRKLLKIEKVKKEYFSFNHINEVHRKIDKSLRVFSAISLITLYSVLLFYYEDFIYLFFFAIIAFTILDYLIRAFFEWKYTHDPKQSILTVTELLIIVVAATIMIIWLLPA
ncbi:hypothetical protein CSV80_06715 [Sporosarcina sp. P12(2017)]|uniref:DUF4181 domain-containing protein n=1 Tax=unclassified Sporosarcina TaxID=2647733 RepID=UPI000C172E9E|nr:MULTISPECIES: DUF4181 domain-containing protein [unclassified Sporosarcina]PIC57991.1 hypothetical protein CSV81_06860 [Sporosarcina sp. P10]PIC61374.1 hypothetical protein CSV80_06715 [Sporosarcina sp. P12(2017)]